MILIIDNYDSFTYNLAQVIGMYSKDVLVVRNDKITVNEIASSIKPQGIIISPGPGRPENAGICVQVIRKLGSQIPILGVCLGHQAIGYTFGAQIIHAPSLMHGKVSKVSHQNDKIFSNIPNPFEATRYHSLVIARDNFPADLLITASAEDQTIMGIKHKSYSIQGVQFHPESILTTEGPQLIANWLNSLTETA